MLIGTCNLKLNTNSLSTANSTDIKLILKKKQGEELKQFLNRRIEELNTGRVTEKEQEEASDDKYDIEVTIKDIIKNGLLSLYGGTILMVLGSFMALVADLFADLGEEMKLGGIIAFFRKYSVLWKIIQGLSYISNSCFDTFSCDFVAY